MGKRLIRCGLLVVIAIVLVLVFFAVNPFGSDTENEEDVVDLHQISTEVDTEDEFIDESSPENENVAQQTAGTIIMFHNGTGPMCIDALGFFEEHDIQVEEHLTTDIDFSSELAAYREEFNDESEGVSYSFGYYPMIFIGGRAFSGFSSEIGQEILRLI